MNAGSHPGFRPRDDGARVGALRPESRGARLPDRQAEIAWRNGHGEDIGAHESGWTAFIRDMSDQTVFRVLAAAILISVGFTRDGVRILAYLRTKPRPSLGDLVSDFLRNNRNARIGSLLLLLLALACFAGLFLFIANPDSMAWSQVPLPSGVRWLGAALAGLGAGGEIWGLVYLGRQYSALLRVREDHALIDGGPYAWVRHPMYSFGVPFLTGLGIMTANWFILATALLTIVAIVLRRVPEEEAMLLEAFGESYRRYTERTGRLFPRLL